MNQPDMIDIGRSTHGASAVVLPMTDVEAELLGNQLQLIDPWTRYSLRAGAVTQHLNACEPGAPRYVLRLDSAPIGAMTVRTNWFGGPYLQFFGILPQAQKQGIGALALHWFEAVARAERARNLWVAASEFNSGAARLYERHGFQRVALVDDLIVDGINEVLLRKRL